MQFWGVTDPGCVRTQNQDAYKMERLDRNTLLCVICDGMGGAKSGNVASSLAVDVFTEEVRRCWAPGMGPEEAEQMLRGAAKLANFTVFDQSQSLEEFSGMGTTLVALLIQGKEAIIVNIGDRRAYRVGKNGIRRLTTDHSLVQMMVERGDLTPEQARNYPGKNYITRAVGTETVAICDVFHLDVERGDCLLLCSDGLSNMIDEQEILFEVVHGINKQYCCQRLLDIAKNRGAPDNVTAVLVLI